jgi:hypothetical protein
LTAASGNKFVLYANTYQIIDFKNYTWPLLFDIHAGHQLLNAFNGTLWPYNVTNKCQFDVAYGSAPIFVNANFTVKIIAKRANFDMQFRGLTIERYDDDIVNGVPMTAKSTGRVSLTNGSFAGMMVAVIFASILIGVAIAWYLSRDGKPTLSGS